MMLSASFLLSLIAPTIKALNYIPLMELIFFRNLFSILIIPFIIKKKKLPFVGKEKCFLLLRSFCGFVTIVGSVYTFMKMNLTDAMAIRQLSPFFIIILASIFLREKFERKHLFVFLISFLGALLIIKPGFRAEIFPAIVGVISILFSASGHTVLRRLRLSNHPFVIVFYFALFSAITSAIILLLQGNIYIPNNTEFLMLMILGLLSFLAQTAISYAYKFSPANIVSLYLYSRITFTSILGFIFFREMPGILSIIGSVLIILSGYIHFGNKNDSEYFE